MAEQIPYGVAVSLINRLASSAFAEFGRIYGVRDELAKLKETVEFINARLLDAEEKQEQDQSHAVKYWISRLKKVLHDADDLFDDFLIEDLREKVDGHGKIVRKVRNFFSGSNPILFRSNMARKIEAIQKKFIDVAKDMAYLNFQPRDRIFEENVSEWRKTSSFVEESEIIGRKESKKDIINLLMQTNGNQNVSLIAVVGVGGLGKTALAQLVYNDAEVQKFFSKHMWVCVSENFEVKTLTKKILESLNNRTVDDLELDPLQKELRQSLSGQRYLLVLDDVWNKSYENWDRLRSSLTSCATGSKILVTTRLEEVAKTMSVSTPYVLGGLSKKQSFTLFKKLAFGEDDKMIDPSLLSIGEKIVEKCGGVPLAIRAIGSLLRTKNGENEWLNILVGDIWKLSEDTERVMTVLKLSYKHLPIELRQCFAYCCLYPKDSVLKKEELVQLWMAQGYLECSTGMKCMEDVGNDYVKILLMRSFFQDVMMDQYGDITYFKMHDLMHDLAMDVAGTDCYLHSERKGIVGTPTHLSLDKGISIPLDLSDANGVRTILWPLGGTMFPNDHSPKKKLSIIWKFKSLRAVNLCKLDIRELPGSIDRLKHLRYLKLSNCSELTRLPENISNLVQLQTLKLTGCRKLEFFASITKLISLRHFVSSGCTAFEHGMPAGLGRLISLQTLEEFVVGEDPKFAKLNELKEVNNLRGQLLINNLGSVKDVELESKDINLKEKKNLRSLKLHWGLEEDNKDDDSLVLLKNLHPPENLKELEVWNYGGVRYPSWICSLTNIVRISLFSCRHLPRLDQLPLLKHLHILEMRDDVWCEYISCFSSSSLPTPISTSFFPSLETLDIESCKQNGLIVLPPFPRLSSLSIRHCRQLTCMPTFPHLVKLKLWNCSMKLLIDTLKMNKATLTQEANPKPSLVTNNDTLHSSSFTPLSKLKYLQMWNVDPTGIKELPEEWMQNLISLERLHIDPLHAPLFRSMRHLPAALQEMTIGFSEMNRDVYEAYKIEEDTTQGQPLHCLRSLQRIQVIGGNYMRELPEWICNIPSLREMIIFRCENLESLPEGMGHLTNLQSLEIPYSNPVLKERCQRGTGADWPKIAHIPYIMVDRDQM